MGKKRNDTGYYMNWSKQNTKIGNFYFGGACDTYALHFGKTFVSAYDWMNPVKQVYYSLKLSV